MARVIYLTLEIHGPDYVPLLTLEWFQPKKKIEVFPTRNDVLKHMLDAYVAARGTKDLYGFTKQLVELLALSEPALVDHSKPFEPKCNTSTSIPLLVYHD